MTAFEMRTTIAKVHTTESWQQKVSKMSDNQVIAVYKKFERNGDLDVLKRRENELFAERYKKALAEAMNNK